MLLKTLSHIQCLHKRKKKRKKKKKRAREGEIKGVPVSGWSLLSERDSAAVIKAGFLNEEEEPN